jgi:hypothetical protein
VVKILTGVCFVETSNHVRRGDTVSVNIFADIQGLLADGDHGHVRNSRHAWLFDMERSVRYCDGHGWMLATTAAR